MTEKKGFRNWFENVFWYHYKWWFLGAVFLVALIVFIGIESAGNEDYDMTVVFAQSDSISRQQAETVLDAISESVGDLDGNGEVNLNYVSVGLGMSYSQMTSQGVSMQDMLMLYMVDSECSLFFIDDEISMAYCAMGYFEDKLSDYGIETAPDDPLRVSVANTQVFRDAGLSDMGHYAMLIDWTTVDKGSQERTDAAVNAIKTLLSD